MNILKRFFAKVFRKDLIRTNEARAKILNIEKALRQFPNAKIGDSFPLKHTFADGMYVREIFVPKGNLIVTKIHKKSHPCFIIKGDCSILTEEGVKRVKAPYHMITPAGTKRAVYVHEDTVWVTVHNTKETDLQKIEKEVIVESFDKFDNILDTKKMEAICK